MGVFLAVAMMFANYQEPLNMTQVRAPIMSMYPRYSGLLQPQPLSAEEREFDELSAEIDQLLPKVGDKRNLRAYDLMWLQWFGEKRFWMRFDQLKESRDHLRKLAEE